MTESTDDIDKTLKWILPASEGVSCLSMTKKVTDKYSPESRQTPDFAQQFFSTFTHADSKGVSDIITKLRLAGVKWPEHTHVAVPKLTFELQPTGDKRLSIDPPVLSAPKQDTSSRLLKDAVRQFIQPRPLPIHSRAFKTSGQSSRRHINRSDMCKTLGDLKFDVNQSKPQRKLPSPWKTKSPLLASVMPKLQERKSVYNLTLQDFKRFFS